MTTKKNLNTYNTLTALQKKVAAVQVLLEDINGAIESGALEAHIEILKVGSSDAYDSIVDLDAAIEDALEEERLNGSVP